MEEDIIKAREEGIRMGAELAAMHGSDATSEELANAFFDGCEVGYKKASEELQSYIDLYKDLAEKAEKIAREVIDKYSKWTPCSEQLPDYDEDVLVTDFYDNLGWCMHIWHRTHDGKGIDYWEAEDGHFIDINYADYWMPRPKPPKESEKDG